MLSFLIPIANTASCLLQALAGVLWAPNLSRFRTTCLYYGSHLQQRLVLSHSTLLHTTAQVIFHTPNLTLSFYSFKDLSCFSGDFYLKKKKKLYSSQFHDFVCLHTYLAHLLFPSLCTYRPICCSQSELLAEYTASFLLLQFEAFVQNTASTVYSLCSYFFHYYEAQISSPEILKY